MKGKATQREIDELRSAMRETAALIEQNWRNMSDMTTKDARTFTGEEANRVNKLLEDAKGGLYYHGKWIRSLEEQNA